MQKNQFMMLGHKVVLMYKKEVALVMYARFPSEMAYGTHIVEVAKGFVKNGFRVNIYYPKTYNKKTIDADPKDYYKVNNINFIELKNIDVTSFRIYSFLPRFLQMIIYTVSGILWSKQVINYNNNEEIVWTTNPNLLIRISKSFKYAIFEKHGQAKYVQRLSMKLLGNRKNVFMVALSEKSGKEISKVTDKFSYLPNGVDENLFKPKSLENDILGIGYIGMLETYKTDKGVLEAVNKIILLNNKFSIFTTIVGGPKNKIQEIENLIKSKNQVDKFHVSNFVAHTEVPKLLQNVDIGIVPYPEDTHISNYASPLKIFEFAAMGIPILVSDIASHLSLKQLNLGIIYFKNGNFEDFSLKLETLINDKNLRVQLKNKSLNNIENLYWKNRMKRLIVSVRSSIG